VKDMMRRIVEKAARPHAAGICFAPRCGLVPLLCCCLLLAACLEIRLPEGVVATVNGEPIYLRTVQTLLDSRSAALGTLQRPSLENMKRQYGKALGTLIIHALVRQELERRQIPVGDTAIEQVVALVRDDYGSGGLSKFLTDESLDEAGWQALMRDHLTMLTFEKRVLLPGIRVRMDEVRAYYQEHQADFRLPETLDVCFASSENREALDAFCASFPVGRKTPPETLLAQCLEVRTDEVPPPWTKEVSTLKPGTCLPARRRNGVWESVGLVGRMKAHSLEMADVYPLIEHILQEQKKSAAFEQWLEDSLSRATVRVSPLLRDELLTPPSAKQEANEDEDDHFDMVDASAGAEERFDAGAAGIGAGSVKPEGNAGADHPSRRNGTGGSGRR